MEPKVSTSPPLLLFDGVCNLCNQAVQFIIQRDKKATFRFAALQSEIGQKLLREHQLSLTELKTIVLIDQGKAYLRSTAALRSCRKLGGLWPLLYGFIIIPRPIRDAVYDWISRNRYKWFGKEESCMVPTPELRSRFLG